jgi:hypothetical protein
MGLLAVPASVNEEKLRAFILAQPGVSALHDLHVWPISTTDTAMTALIIMPAGHPGDAFLHELAHEMEHDFGIGHATIRSKPMVGISARCIRMRWFKEAFASGGRGMALCNPVRGGARKAALCLSPCFE